MCATIFVPRPEGFISKNVYKLNFTIKTLLNADDQVNQRIKAKNLLISNKMAKQSAFMIFALIFGVDFATVRIFFSIQEKSFKSQMNSFLHFLFEF